MSLVLDWVNSSEGSPVLSGWDTFGGEGGVLNFGGVLSSETEKFFVLGVSPGGHEVVANGEGVLWVGVDLGVLSSLDIEDLFSEVVLFLGSIGDTVLGDVLEESVGGLNLFLADFFETKGEGSFAESVHLFF